MLEIYLCRHGETAWTVTGQHTGKTDLDLTDKGKEQAKNLRKKLEGIVFAKVFTSPLKRALSTCSGMNAEIQPLAVEWDYGDYEGLTTKEIQQKRAHWDLFKDGAPHGESLEQVGKRADQLLSIIRGFDGKIVLFSHGHFLRILAARFLDLEPKMGKIFALDVASLSILAYQRNQPVIALWNDC
jgi:broad specificity phosphatase PhoE